MAGVSAEEPEKKPVPIEREEDEKEGIEPSDLKVILLGDSAVGKSKLVERFLLDKYNSRTRSTYALTLYRYDCKMTVDDTIGEEEFKVDIWDTAGQEKFNSMHASYYYGAHACIMVFDVTRKATYQHLPNWYNELRTYCPKIPCIVLANKIDFNKEVTKKSFKFPIKHGLPMRFVSAADGTNVVQIFQEAIRDAMVYKRTSTDIMADVMDLLQDERLGEGHAGRFSKVRAEARREDGGDSGADGSAAGSGPGGSSAGGEEEKEGDSSAESGSGSGGT